MSLKILMIEKDPSTADLLVPSLTRKGHEVVVVRNQREGLTRARSWWPDLLVVDVASFGGNGYRVSDSLRRKLAGVLTILLLEKGHEAAGDGADAYMTPPFHSRGLLHRVKKLESRITRNELSAGRLVLDPNTRLLRNGEETHYLRPKEAALLGLFMNNPGKVLTRQVIMRQVWETDYVGDTRTINVHVRWLREKIEIDPHHPLVLRTIRGVGYRFEVPGEASTGADE